MLCFSTLLHDKSTKPSWLFKTPTHHAATVGRRFIQGTTESASLIDRPALAAQEWTSVADNNTKTNEYIRAYIPSEILITFCGSQHPALQASFRTFLLCIYLAITYIETSIIRLKTSYRHLTEQENGRIHWEYFPTNSTILGSSSLDPGLLVPRLFPHVCRSPRVSHHRLEPLYSSAVYLWAACVRLQTYLRVPIRMARELF
jgi:hypothetical protein